MEKDDRDVQIEQLKDTVRDQDIEIKVLKKMISILTKEGNAEKLKALRMRLRKQYEAASEQLYLFDDVETTTELGALEETPEDVSIDVSGYTRKKSRSGCNLPPDTPVVDVYDDEGPSTCSRCGATQVKAGEKVYETFTRIERTVIVRRHVQQYTCPECTPEAGEGRIVETPKTGNMLDGTIADPTLFASFVENKFAYAQTLFREAQKLADIGISRFTISSWLMKVGVVLERNMAPCLEKLIYSYPLVNVDETPVKVLGLKDEDGNPKAHRSKYNSWMIVRAACDSRGRHGPVMFTFSDNRRNETLANYLKSYTGVVQTDGLAGYDNAEKVGGFTHIDCMVHARRKAVEACGKRKSGKAYELLKIYASFFHNEGLLKDRFDNGEFATPEDYVTERRSVLEPLLDEIHKFCQENVNKVLPESTSPAFNYPLQRWETLKRFLDYPFATSSNQRAENAIRPFCVGRRNWLFNITESGAKVSAFYYSLVESCKAMGINTRDYLTWLVMNAGKLEDGDEKAWMAMLPGKSDISSAIKYREKIFNAIPDSKRTEPYKLRGKKV